MKSVFYLHKHKLLGVLFASLFNCIYVSGNTFRFSEDRNVTLTEQKISFIENRGQVSDQNHQPRHDVLYSGSAKDLVYHLRNNGISYQLASSENKMDVLIPSQTRIYRLDINWVNANPHSEIKTDAALEGLNTYYLETCKQGIDNVKSYEGITYKNIYNKIDLHYYSKNGNLKYDYIVAPNAGYKQIQLEVKGAQKIILQKDGSLLFKTPLAEILEGAPLVYQEGHLLKAKWVVKNNLLSFEIENYNPALELLIDPATRVWGTYYGGTGTDSGSSCITDASGNVYMSGTTDSNSGTLIATTGSHQTTLGGGFDVFLVKFNASGIRQWSTYYGSSGNEFAGPCAINGSGDIYLSGITSSATSPAIATPGSHQASYGGGIDDVFLVKFNSAGIRQWGTYFGNTGMDLIGGCATDASGNIYISGQTRSSTGMSTTGSYQSVFGGGTDDAFFAKFNGSGVLQWSSYFGGTGNDVSTNCTIDPGGNLYIVGYTTSSGNIASTGSHQTTLGGVDDAFLTKINSSGIVQWSTYYGGSASDKANSCTTDGAGNVFMTGKTVSSGASVIATSGSYQGSFGGGPFDAYLVKFNGAGSRQWGTYFGDSGDDQGTSCVTDAGNNIYIVGFTGSTSNIATSGSHQVTLGGSPDDAYFAKFNNSGTLQWASYYGSSASDGANGCAIDGSGNIYFTGRTTSGGGTAIATSGSHQTTLGGTTDAFLVKFSDCTIPGAPSNTTPTGNLSICNNNSTTLTTLSAGPVNWFATSTSTTVLGTGVAFVTPTLTSGTYSFYAETTNSCSASARTEFTLVVGPVITINSGAVCSGSPFTLAPTGAATYTFQGGSAIVSPAITTTYSVTGTNGAGCVGSATATVNVNPLPVITVNSGTICSGGLFTIVPSGAATYTYSGGNSIVNPTVTTSYSVNGTNALGCTSTLAAISTVTVMPFPTPTITVNSGEICSGSSFTIAPNGASTYTVSGGSTVVNPTVTTSYTVTGTSASGCTSAFAAISNVTVKPLPLVTAVTSKTLLCRGQTATLTANASGGSAPYAYSWSSGATTSTIAANPTLTTTYTVVVTSTGSCSAKTTLVQTVSACSGLFFTDGIMSAPFAFPNPNNGEFSLAVPEGASLEIHNAIGQLVLRKDVEAGENRIDLTDRPNGLYFIILMENNKTRSVSRFVKE